MQKFGLEHNCDLVYNRNLLVVYHIKHHNHSETCKKIIYNNE
jgi:hypothetical protein